jgi:hypothetical protein
MKDQRFLVFISNNAPVLNNDTGILPIDSINGKPCIICTDFEIVHPFGILTISQNLETNQLGSDMVVTVPSQHIDYVFSVQSEEVRKIPGFLVKPIDKA